MDDKGRTVQLQKDIDMPFGAEKCSELVVKRGKRVKSYGIKMPDDKVIKSLKEGEGYKYLGVLQADEVQVKEMKGKVGSEYKRRVKRILETKLNGENVIEDNNLVVLWLQEGSLTRETEALIMTA
eukprot:gene6459-biopygen8057